MLGTIIKEDSNVYKYVENYEYKTCDLRTNCQAKIRNRRNIRLNQNWKNTFF